MFLRKGRERLDWRNGVSTTAMFLTTKYKPCVENSRVALLYTGKASAIPEAVGLEKRHESTTHALLIPTWRIYRNIIPAAVIICYDKARKCVRSLEPQFGSATLAAKFTTSRARGNQRADSATKHCRRQTANTNWVEELVLSLAWISTARTTHPPNTFEPLPDQKFSIKLVEIERTRPARVAEVSTEQRRNEGTGETGDPRENSPTNGIVRHDSDMRKSRVTRPGIEPGSPWGVRRRKTWRGGRYRKSKYSLVGRGSIRKGDGEAVATWVMSSNALPGMFSLDGSRETTRRCLSEYGATPKLKGWGTGDPRENPSTNDIVRHDSRMRKSGDLAGD
ncbi:hypothetical protein PR048_031453 [Dryococelus australis]|uniref:Uncharacterized protein n=1 Tax=Dryococelus australis TaxID=614101 RepID=A0ABQ9G5B7_9NEOP|nr:hypothetical protein PR048_031453 [Dryococelus australis]